MVDLITIGNITADLYFKADNLTQKDDRFYLAIGGKYHVDDFLMSVGGGGANVAIGARKNGLRTAVAAVVGNNVFRKGIMNRLRRAKVNTKMILFNQKDANVSVLLLTKSGERTAIAYQSSHKHLIEDRHIVRNILKTRAVYFGNLPHVSMNERRTLMKKLKDKKITIFVNIGERDCCKPKHYVRELLEYTDVLILNTHEFADLIRKPFESINYRKNVLRYFPTMEKKLVVVTDGKNGSFAYEKNHVFYQPIIKEKKLVDTTGVGDGYTAGFIASYLRHENIQEAMKTGSGYAAKILAKIGAN